jgi:hypothetical protein
VRLWVEPLMAGWVVFICMYKHINFTYSVQIELFLHVWLFVLCRDYIQVMLYKIAICNNVLHCVQISSNFYSPNMNVGNENFLPLLKRLDDCIL